MSRIEVEGTVGAIEASTADIKWVVVASGSKNYVVHAAREQLRTIKRGDAVLVSGELDGKGNVRNATITKL